MGVKGLLYQLPCTPAIGFYALVELSNRDNPVDIDTGTLIFVCALVHIEAYRVGNYEPSLREFQRLLIVLGKVHKWNFTCIFDGIPPPEKQHEHR